MRRLFCLPLLIARAANTARHLARFLWKSRHWRRYERKRKTLEA